MAEKESVKIQVHKDFYNFFEEMRRKKQQEMGIIRLGQSKFSKMLVNSKSIKYPKPKNVRKKYKR